MTEDELENEYLEFGRTMINIIRKNWCPERSKREDSKVYVRHADGTYDKLPSTEEMRCSEQSGN